MNGQGIVSTTAGPRPHIICRNTEQFASLDQHGNMDLSQIGFHACRLDGDMILDKMHGRFFVDSHLLRNRYLILWSSVLFNFIPHFLALFRKKCAKNIVELLYMLRMFLKSVFAHVSKKCFCACF